MPRDRAGLLERVASIEHHAADRAAQDREELRERLRRDRHDPPRLVLHQELPGRAALPAEVDDLRLMPQQTRLQIANLDRPLLAHVEPAAARRGPEAMGDLARLAVQREARGARRISAEEEERGHARARASLDGRTPPRAEVGAILPLSCPPLVAIRPIGDDKGHPPGALPTRRGPFRGPRAPPSAGRRRCRPNTIPGEQHEIPGRRPRAALRRRGTPASRPRSVSPA
jgi:hypothetical protein